jgi:hypothetical protein
MKSKLIIEHGETTCASEPGKFCRFLGATNFGTVPVCMLFGNQKLDENEEGWVKRCDDCLKEFAIEKESK